MKQFYVIFVIIMSCILLASVGLYIMDKTEPRQTFVPCDGCQQLKAFEQKLIEKGEYPYDKK